MECRRRGSTHGASSCYKTLKGARHWGKIANFAKISKIVDVLLTILGVMLLGLGLYLCVRPYVPSVLASYGGLWLLQWGGLMEVPTVTLSYWGVMVVIVVTINSMQQPALTKATQGLPQMVIGAAVGAVAGGVFFARTPKGAALRFPSKRFLQYVCAKGFPTVISVSLTGIAIMVAVAAYNMSH